MKFTCPNCHTTHDINAASLMGSVSSEAKAAAARENAKAVHPWKTCKCATCRARRKKLKAARKDSNQVAHGVVAATIALTQQPPSSRALRVVR